MSVIIADISACWERSSHHHTGPIDYRRTGRIMAVPTQTRAMTLGSYAADSLTPAVLYSRRRLAGSNSARMRRFRIARRASIASIPSAPTAPITSKAVSPTVRPK